MLKIKLTVLILCCLFVGCNSTENKPIAKHSETKGFPELRSLGSEKNNTRFATTLESEIDLKKNAIYASTLLFCWNRFEKDYGKAVNISKRGLTELNESNSFYNTLKENEYKTVVEATGKSVTITSIFNKQLPFKKPMNKLNGVFKGENIKAFGISGPNHQIEIIYYNSDSDFALRLLPEDEEHEIIVCQANFSQLNSLKKQFFAIRSKETQFNAQAENWMKSFNKRDEFSMPKLGFNLDTRFKEIEGAQFQNKTSSWIVAKAYQQNAMQMNEKGASAYSKAVMVMIESIAQQEIEDIKVPEKHLQVNSDYVVFFKRKDCNYPYFGAYITNSRWMISK